MQVSAVSQKLFSNNWPRSNEAHLPAYNIPKLRQFVQARAAQKSPDSCYARIVTKFVIAEPFSLQLRLSFQHVAQDPVSVRHHRSKLQAIESFAILADASMTKDNWTTFAMQQNRNSQN
jgi:hypothetical protein